MRVRLLKKRLMSRSFPMITKTTIENANNKEDKTDNITVVEEKEDSTEKKAQKTKNKSNKKQETMTENEKLEMAQELVQELKPETKVIKKDKGLIERTESSKIILTEDNKQILND